MIKRIYTYLKEMYPPVSRAIISAILFFTIYFLILASNHITHYAVGFHEWIGVLTVFVFLLSLRIADEFKDLDTDRTNFPNRPLPSGRVTKRDLIVLLLSFQLPTIVLNLVYMNNLTFFVALYVYGVLMSVWFFAKKIIKPNLLLALVTHNPVQLLLTAYVASYVCNAFGLTIISPGVILAAIALYLPGLVWEIGRKIRAPRDETVYQTYSKLWGYKRAVLVVTAIMTLATVIDCLLLGIITPLLVVPLVLVYAATLVASLRFMHRPKKNNYRQITTFFIYSQQPLLLLASYGAVNGWFR